MKRTSNPLGPLTPIEFHVLLSLSERALHGYAILQDVARRTRDQVTLRTGTLYTVIKRMLDSRWIEETGGPGDDERRRYYRLTDFGRRVAIAEAERLEEMVAVVRATRLLDEPGTT